MSERNEHLTPVIAINIVVAFAGGAKELAEDLGISCSAISVWRKKGCVSAKHAKRMSQMTHGIVSPADLCPDVF